MYVCAWVYGCRGVCMCVPGCMAVWVYGCMYVCAWVYGCRGVCMCVPGCMGVGVYVCVCLGVWVYVCLCVCVGVCVCGCMGVWVYGCVYFVCICVFVSIPFHLRYLFVNILYASAIVISLLLKQLTGTFVNFVRCKGLKELPCRSE